MSVTTLKHYYRKGNNPFIYDAEGPSASAVPVKLTQHFIFIGCAKVDIDVIEYILSKHKEHFKPQTQEVVL